MSNYEILANARKNGHAIAAMNAVNLETAQAVVWAAEAEDAPVILQVSENAARYGGLYELFAIAAVLKQEAIVPVIVHFDHAETLESAKEAVDLGFDSVMLESAELKPKEYLTQLEELVKYAEANNCLIEAEFEITEKGSRHAKRLNPKLIAQMVEESGCHLVAVDIGSKHKMTAKEATLDLAHLKHIAKFVKAPLVLHGSSGVKEAELRTAVALGISKVNVATELMLSFTDGVREILADKKQFDARKYLAKGRASMQDRAAEIIRLLS